MFFKVNVTLVFIHAIYKYTQLAEIPGFARDSRSIIIHVLVAVLPQFNMSRAACPTPNAHWGRGVTLFSLFQFPDESVFVCHI